jgi:hypothetical protein
LTSVDGLSPGPQEGEWLASSTDVSGSFDFPLYPYFLGKSGYSALYLVDAHERAHLLQMNNSPVCGIFSNDGKHLATIQAELTRNVWTFSP